MTTVVITGANRGLGLALAKLHLAQGAALVDLRGVRRLRATGTGGPWV